MVQFRKFPASAALAAFAALTSAAQAQEVIFLSTQLRPIEEATKVRQIILKGAPGPVTFVVEEPSPFQTRMDAETQAGKRTISMVGALHGELQPLVGSKGLEPVDDLATKARERGVTDGMMALGKLGSDRQMYIPWMQATYVMAAKKEALQYLPAGADANALTYAQLGYWAKAIQDKPGRRALGFPAGPKGLMARFFQGYLYSSYTGGVVINFQECLRRNDVGRVQGALDARESEFDLLRFHAGTADGRRRDDRVRPCGAPQRRA
jgi:multiple sugar transport system substrate-binding protein